MRRFEETSGLPSHVAKSVFSDLELTDLHDMVKDIMSRPSLDFSKKRHMSSPICRTLADRVEFVRVDQEIDFHTCAVGSGWVRHLIKVQRRL